MAENDTLNPQQIAELLLQNQHALTGYVFSITRNFHLAEDVFQDTTAKSIALEGKFESADHLLNWFRVAARNRAIDLIRAHEGKYVGLSESTLALLEEDWAANHGENKSIDALTECFKELTPRSRELVRMKYFENKSGEEIANFMGAKVESAYQALSRIHKALSKCISKRLSEEAL